MEIKHQHLLDGSYLYYVKRPTMVLPAPKKTEIDYETVTRYRNDKAIMIRVRLKVGDRLLPLGELHDSRTEATTKAEKQTPPSFTRKDTTWLQLDQADVKNKLIY